MDSATSSYREKVTPSLSYTVGVDKILAEGKSDFQDILLIQSKCFGRTLVLDNQVQSCETDEACYHETLVHPAMLAHPNPKRVYIGGGGEGATAREILKHKSVETCVMVDLDKKVVDFCREHMTQWNKGVFEDPRFSCYYEDAYQWLVENVKTDADKFDVIVMDICDPPRRWSGLEALHCRVLQGGVAEVPEQGRHSGYSEYWRGSFLSGQSRGHGSLSYDPQHVQGCLRRG
ncbi:hypothetical protein FOZ60_002649 [Perkinsus olseni]|uniref:thermospermine synthase n=1 Tax=Perkinsus olseni TaxID=32597 RepID=A0A7J6NY79_PEROL|nr:hypothetical protein FOZ60_002649 [Perkinsus olseni]